MTVFCDGHSETLENAKAGLLPGASRKSDYRYRVRGAKKKQGFVARHRSSGCLSLTVPLAATFDQKMLKRPTLDLSARRHPGPEPLFSFSEYEAFALLNGLARLATGLRSFNHAPRPSRSRKGARADPSAMSGQAFRSASDTLKSPPRRYRSRQYGPGVSYHSSEEAARC